MTGYNLIINNYDLTGLSGIQLLSEFTPVAYEARLSNMAQI